MKHLVPFLAGALAAPALLVSLAHASTRTDLGTHPARPAPEFTAAPTQPVIATDRGGSIHDAQGLDHSRMYYDEPGDGSLWALGANWKASFGPSGATYFPRVGPSVPRSFPHALTPNTVTIGGTPVAFVRTASAVRTGDRVALDRGSFTEAYDLAPGSIEQSFVFSSSPGAGDLVLHIPIASELQAVETDEGLEFRCDQGRVTYSRAVAVDALGRRTPAATRLEDGSITIRVGADVLAQAAFPLVVDPVLNAIFPDSTTEDTFSIDAAYDEFNGVWVVAYEQVFSATDHDVYAKEYSSTGTLMATATVDFTGDLWAAPRIADLAFPHEFLVVAGVTASGSGAKTIRGRTVQPNGTILTLGSQFSISGSLTGACVRPDVGGDPFPSTSAFWCVAFEHDISSSDHEVAYCIVNSSSLVLVGPNHLTPLAGSTDESPSISKSDDTSAWLVAWERFSFSTQGVVEGARIDWDGFVLSGPFDIGSCSQPPCASSPLSGTERTLVTFQSGFSGIGSGSTILVALLDGSTVLQTANLMTLENSATAGQDQIQPSVDSDGEHFLVSYSEFDSTFHFWRLFVTDLAAVGDTLEVVQNHLEPQPGLGLSELGSNVAAARASGALDHRYLVVYDIRQNDTDHDVAGRFIDGIDGGSTSLFCFGTAAACPCGNGGSGSGGCGNSANAAGATLAIAGTPSTLNDSIVLNAGGMPASTTCLFFQGSSAGSPAVFGDGLRCAAGTVIRLATKVANPLGVASYPAPGDPAVSVHGQVSIDGGSFAYQVWYRNAAAFCTSATSNLTNGAIIGWAR